MVAGRFDITLCLFHQASDGVDGLPTGEKTELLRTGCAVGAGGFGSGLGVTVQFPEVVVVVASLLTSRTALLLSSIIMILIRRRHALCLLPSHTLSSLFSSFPDVFPTSWRKPEARKYFSMGSFIRLLLSLV